MKALIPAAGLGTRWHPWSRFVPKEFLPLNNYPAIKYILDEALAARVTDIGVIINEAKEILRQYVDEIWKMENPGVRIVWFYQSSPLGVGDALLCSKDWVADQPTAVLYPDEIHPPGGGLPLLRKHYEHSKGFWLGITLKKQKKRQMVLAIENDDSNTCKITGPLEESLGQRVGYGTARYILPTGFNHIKESFCQTTKEKDKEHDDDLIFARLWKQGVYGLRLPEPIYDLGSPHNWYLAVTSFCESGEDN